MEPATQHYVRKKATWLSLKTIIGVAVFLLSCGAFAVIADEMVLEKENNFDYQVFAQLSKITTPGLTHAMEVITFFGSSYFMLPAYGVLILFCLLKRNLRQALNIAAIGLIGNAAVYTFKDLFHRQRPLHPLVRKLEDFSFPSGHSFASFTFFGLLLYITVKKQWSPPVKWLVGCVLVLMWLLVATSRVYLHFHYASDVIAGSLLACVWLMLCFWIFGQLDRKYPVRR